MRHSINKTSMVSRRSHGGFNDDLASLNFKQTQLERLNQVARVISIQEKLDKNKKKVEIDVSHFLLKASRKNGILMVDNRFSNMPICKYSGFPRGLGVGDYDIYHEVEFLSIIELPFVKKIPPYTTWVFVDRNQGMFEDQFVVGRQNYDDQRQKEALIHTGSEEVNEESAEQRHKFVQGDDQILCYETCKASSSKDSRNEPGISLETSLSAALDSFDSLFYRRCMVFDCRVHGCPQTLILPSEKQPIWSESEDDRKPCSDHCYLRLRADQDVLGGSTINIAHKDTGNTDIAAPKTYTSTRSIGKRKVVDHSSRKCKKLYPWDIIRALSETRLSPDAKSRHHVGASNEDPERTTKNLQSVSIELWKPREGVLNSFEWKPTEKELYSKGVEIFGRNRGPNLCLDLFLLAVREWSCLIARNLLSGLKTCTEVFNYMRESGSSLPQKSIASSSFSEENGNAKTDHREQEIPIRPRLLRRRRGTRKLKYTRKSTRQPSSRKRTADDKIMIRKHYTPCGCKAMCGYQCPCFQKETRCEKYCRCTNSCKNRFRGCHCAKNQCRTKQCPCFAARRECDPDICRNCWVSCGDGTLGEPPKQRNSECDNMKLLLRQQQRILLSKSEVAGWGAFLTNSVKKDDYLGEYAGELISHPEAEERGTSVGHAKSVYLFDLDNQYVIDAHRKGNMLRFINHSSNPNSYVKAMLVAGDHRLGIYAKEHIEAGEELFFYYMYGPEQVPPWAQKPDDFKRDNSSALIKHQSH